MQVKLLSRTLALMVCCSTVVGAFLQSASGQDNSTNQRQDLDQPIRFNFQEEQWSVVIPWFANQAGFSLQPITGEWPEGTFFLKDDSEYTAMEALDQLNHSLRMRDPAFTLIRNRNMLVLARLADAEFPNELIETVTPEELNQRGKFETVICVFDLGELNIGEMFDELAPMVSSSNNNFFAQFPAANQIRVRETGGTLRIMRDLIERAKKNKKKHVEVYTLKHIDADSFMLMARGQLDMDSSRDSSRNDSISITREPLGRRLFVRATDAMHDRFADVAKAIDVPADQIGEVEIRPRRFQQYTILVDPELGRGMVEFVLEGRPGAKMEQDKINNSVMVWGTDEDHALVVEALKAIGEVSGEAFEIIALEYGDARLILSALQNLLRQTGADVKPEAPVVIADTDKNQILARGKTKDVDDIRRIVEKLDATAKSEINRVRTDTRIIAIDDKAAESLPDLLQYLLEGEGRKNPIQIVRPQDRKESRSRGPRGNFRGVERNPNQAKEFESRSDDDDNSEDDDQLESSRLESNPLGQKSNFRHIASSAGFLIATQWLNLTRPLINAGLPPSGIGFGFQEDETLIGRNSEVDDEPNGYRAPSAIESVPGDPIVARFLDNGKLVLSSRDLDALDDLEYAIKAELGKGSSLQPPEIFAIGHRSANDVKSVLEAQLGLASSGGGGDGANPLGSLARNMLPIGGLLDGLMGGGGAASGGANQLEGDVKIIVDLPLNYLLVSGATANDLDLIEMYIEILDQPNPVHMVDLVGQTYPIKIKNRDAEEVKLIIEESIPQYLDSGKSEGPQQQNNDAMRMMQMMQQLAGGGRGGGGGSEQKEAKARLAVDKERNYLIVTGPEHIYNKIQFIVMSSDTPTEAKPRISSFLDGPKMDVETLKTLLETKFPNNIEIKQKGSTDSSSSSARAANTGTTNRGNNQASQTSQPPNQDQMRRQAMEMMMRGVQQQQQRGPGGGGGGGGRGGGDGGRGGGDGGRGGGGRGGGFPGGGGAPR